VSLTSLANVPPQARGAEMLVSLFLILLCQLFGEVVARAVMSRNR
jgi:hypothetical protein